MSIYEKTVCDCFAEAVGRAKGTLGLSCRIYADLGFESIDVLDATFRIEKAFGLKVDEKFLFSLDGIKREDFTISHIAEKLLALHPHVVQQ